MKQVLLGAHVSVAGGLARALDRGRELGCDAIQLFVKNPNRWQGAPLAKEEAARFRRAYRATRIGPLVAHAAYLVNLGARDRSTLFRSRRGLARELDRCELLGIGHLVVHPGSHMGAGEKAGIERVAKSLSNVLAGRSGRTRVLLETTAGQGTTLGRRLEELASILRRSGCAERLGICVDTCHVFAAGYPVHEEGGYRDFFARLGELFGPGEPACIHLNDSRGSLGSRRDRHANLGDGEIGIDLFARLLNDPRLRGIPMILETPRGEDGQGHRRDLELLRSLAAS